MKIDTSTLVSKADDLETFMTEEGFDLDADWSAVERKLKFIMGRNRFSAFLRTMKRFNNEHGSIDEVYACMRGRAEVHALFSSHREAANVSFEAGISALSHHLSDAPVSVADMGCMTGATTRFLASKFRTHNFVGIEREEHFLSDAKIGAPVNCSFVSQDFANLGSEGPFDVFLCICGLELPPNSFGFDTQIWSTNPSSNYYALQVRNLFLPCFEGWARVAKIGAVAVCVLRIPSSAILWAYVDAANQAGWVIRKESIKRISAGGDLLTFWEMQYRGEVDENDKLSFLEALDSYASIPEDFSRIAFLNLKHSETLFSDDMHFSDGTIRFEIGKHLEGGYLMWSASTQFHALQYCSFEVLEKFLDSPEYIDNPEKAGLADDEFVFDENT